MVRSDGVVAAGRVVVLIGLEDVTMTVGDGVDIELGPIGGIAVLAALLVAVPEVIVAAV